MTPGSARTAMSAGGKRWNKLHRSELLHTRISHPRCDAPMQVQVNHDEQVEIGEVIADRLRQVLESCLSHFADRITRVEMYLGDENGGKAGESDKRCMLEARLANLAPIAVTHRAESLQLAFEGAIEKLDHALSRAVGNLGTH